MGVTMATTKLPIQLPEVVKDTAIPEGQSYWKMVCKMMKNNYTAELQNGSIVTSDFQWEYFTSDHPSHRSGHDIQGRKKGEREDRGREGEGQEKERERIGVEGVKGRRRKGVKKNEWSEGKEQESN